MRTCWSQIRLWTALGFLAALNIAARPYALIHDGEVIVNGIVFHDANGNQRQDARERGLANISVISQAPDAQGGAVNASTVTAADGSFAIQTHVGDRIAIVPSAGYKALQPSGVIVRENMAALAFPLYIDKVVVDRVIRMEPAAVTVPAPQVYVSPLITVPVPVVNIAPAEVTVQPAPVHIAPVIEPATLWVAVAAIAISVVASAAIIGSAIRSHARTLCDIAASETTASACRVKVDASNWKRIAEQVIADATGQVVAVEALVQTSLQPTPILHFRATNSQLFVFSLSRKSCGHGHKFARVFGANSAQHSVVASELRDLWRFFATFMRLPGQLPRAGNWHVSIVGSPRIVVCHQMGCEIADVSMDHMRLAMPLSKDAELNYSEPESCPTIVGPAQINAWDGATTISA